MYRRIHLFVYACISFIFLIYLWICFTYALKHLCIYRFMVHSWPYLLVFIIVFLVLWIIHLCIWFFVYVSCLDPFMYVGIYLFSYESICVCIYVLFYIHLLTTEPIYVCIDLSRFVFIYVCIYFVIYLYAVSPLFM